MKFSDEQLTSYLDGEAQPDLRQQIDFARAQDAHVERHLKSLTLSNKDLRTSFDNMLNEAPDVPKFLNAKSAKSSRSEMRGIHRPMAAAACFVGLLLLSGFIGWQISRFQQQNWHTAAAIYHNL